MAKSVDYRGYTISSIPVQAVGSQDWKSSILISTEREGAVSSQSYTNDTLFARQEDAEIHGITLGQQIIDGKAPEASEA